MNEWWSVVSSIMIGVPIACYMRLNWLGAGMLCGGLEIAISLLSK